MVPLDVPAHITDGHHFVTLSALPLSNPGALGRFRRRDLHIVVIVVGLCIFGPTKDILVKSIRKSVVVCAARIVNTLNQLRLGKYIFHFLFFLFIVVVLKLTPMTRPRPPSSLQVHGLNVLSLALVTGSLVGADRDEEDVIIEETVNVTTREGDFPDDASSSLRVGNEYGA